MSSQFYNFAAQNIRHKICVTITPTTKQEVGKQILRKQKKNGF